MIVLLHLADGPAEPTVEDMREAILFFAGLRGAIERGIGLELTNIDVAPRGSVKLGRQLGEPMIINASETDAV